MSLQAEFDSGFAVGGDFLRVKLRNALGYFFLNSPVRHLIGRHVTLNHAIVTAHNGAMVPDLQPGALFRETKRAGAGPAGVFLRMFPSGFAA